MKLSKFDTLYKSIITQTYAEAENIDKVSKMLDLDKINFDNFNWRSANIVDIKDIIKSILTNEQYAKKYANKIPLNIWKQINSGVHYLKLLADPSQVSENILVILKDYINPLIWKYITNSREGMSQEFLMQVKDKFRWDALFNDWSYSYKDSEKYREKLKSLYPIDFIQKVADSFKSAITWNRMLEIYKNEISADFVEKYINDENFGTHGLTNILKQYMQNPDFYVKGNKDKFNGFDMDFIKKYKKKLDWKEISHFDLKQIPESLKKELQNIINTQLERIKADDAWRRKLEDSSGSWVDSWVEYRKARGLSDGLD